MSEMVRAAERSRARVFDVPGNDLVNSHVKINELLNQHELFHSVMIDEDYLIVGMHVDDTTRRKIIQGEYVDFSKLIPKGRVSVEDIWRW